MNDAVQSYAVYTAIYGGYLVPPASRGEIKCFTGDPKFNNPVMDAKLYKVLSHQFFPDKAVTVWVDGNIWLKQSASYLIERYLGTNDFALFAHPYRKTVWQEFEALRIDPRFHLPHLQRQLDLQEKSYRKEGLPDTTQLYECNFLIRRNTAQVNRLMDAWWSEICRWQWRDQVSLPYVLWKYGADVRLCVAHGVNIREHQDFNYVKHH